MINVKNHYIFDYEQYDVETIKTISVLSDNKKYRLVSVNETGRNILELLNGENSVENVISKISLLYDLPVNVVSDYVIKFVNKLDEDNLIHTLNENIEEVSFQSISRIYLTLTDVDENGLISELLFSKIVSFIEYVEDRKAENKIQLHLRGEPLLHSKLKKILKYLKSKDIFKIWFYTDGLLLNVSYISFLKDKVDFLLLKLYHYKEEDNDSKSTLGHFQKFKENVINCAKNQITCYADIYPTFDNVSSMTEMHQYIYDLGLRGILVHNIDNKNTINQDKVDENVKLNEMYEKEFVKMSNNNEFLNSWRNNRIQANSNSFVLISEEDLCFRSIYALNKRRHCGLGYEELSMDVNGDIFPCHILHYDELKIRNMDEYWNKREEIYGANIVNQGCRNCNVWILCLGGCRAKNYPISKDFSMPREDCADRKKAVKRYLFGTKEVN